MLKDKAVKVLVCTDAAGEGLNLQSCGVVINYDLPWNPMKVEQRIGRIDREIHRHLHPGRGGDGLGARLPVGITACEQVFGVRGRTGGFPPILQIEILNARERERRLPAQDGVAGIPEQGLCRPILVRRAQVDFARPLCGGRHVSQRDLLCDGVVGIRRDQRMVGTSAVRVFLGCGQIDDQHRGRASHGVMLLAGHPHHQRPGVLRRDDQAPGPAAAFRVIRPRQHAPGLVADFHHGVVALLPGLNEPLMAATQRDRRLRRRGADGRQPRLENGIAVPKDSAAGSRGRRAGTDGCRARSRGRRHLQKRGRGDHQHTHSESLAPGRLGALQAAVYNHRMEVRDAQKEGTSSAVADHSVTPTVMDPALHLAEVYRDYPGLRALIMRRTRDPHVAADILQDAAVTTLEKLRAGEIAQPNAIGGYLYRVALNHLRNHRRKDRTAVSSSTDLESVPDRNDDPDTGGIDRAQWADAARRMLEGLPNRRDRELLVRFYLNDDSKEDICAALGLTDEHFNRVIFRAKSRFRDLLERRGYVKADLLTLAAIGLGTGTMCAAIACTGGGGP